ncbi:MAG: cellulase family glycosylhydrolase [Phycisphaera sp.]|nr:cellulase family glycosylhydrolase [Phycisphaera sp.]
MNRLSVFCLIFLIALAARPALCDDAPANLFDNGDFTHADADGNAAHWVRQTKDNGRLVMHNEGGLSYVALSVTDPGKDIFIQQIAKLPPEAKRVTLTARYRWKNIVAGDKSYQCGKVQGRFAKDGKDTGRWIDLGNLTGDGEWTEKTRTVSVPDDVNGIMVRLSIYGSKSGELDVDNVRGSIVTEEDIAALRAQYRPEAEFGPAVSDARYNRLLRGVNINNWFCQPWNAKVNGQKGGFNPEFFKAYITEHDVQMIADAGFDHVRLVTDPLFLMDRDTGELKTELLGDYDEAIRLLRKHGLAVIVDVHPKNPSYKSMAGKPIAQSFITWWGQFAKHLAQTTDPEWVFLETLNEPGGQGYWVSNWPEYQDKLLTVMRANAPHHTFIANGGAYMLTWELPKVVPHTDRNIIWAVHFYEPSPFTHQGAQWMKDWYRPLRNVPWPLTEENLAAAQASVVANDKAADKARSVLADQLRSGWGTEDNLDKRFAEVTQWAHDHDRRVVVGEWGVYTQYAPRDSRLRYLSAFTKKMDELGLGWTIWDYCGAGFDIVENPDVQDPSLRRLDADVIEALGLKPPTQQVKAR